MLIPVCKMFKHIGIVGNGRWGKILHEKLKKISTICFVQTRHYKCVNTNDIDWVFIATPNETHYDIVSEFIDKGVNVFCEKPLALTHDHVIQLYEKAQQKGVRLYVDNVFKYRRETKQVNKSFSSENYVYWTNQRCKQEQCVKELFHILMWHDLCILYPNLKGRKITKCQILENEMRLNIKVCFEKDYVVQFYYDRNSTRTIHTINNISYEQDLPCSDRDPLSTMLRQVLYGTEIDNKEETLFISETLNTIISNVYKKVAVIGGGIFGCTIASRLAMILFNSMDKQ